MNDTSWGMTYEQLVDIDAHYGGRVIVKRDDNYRPTWGKVIQYNRKRATVRLDGGIVDRVTFSKLKPPVECRMKSPEKPIVPPDVAPRPTPKAIPIAAQAVPLLAPASPAENNTVSQSVMIAALLQGHCNRLAEAQAEFAGVEKDYAAIKALRDEAQAKVDAIAAQCASAKRDLDAATTRLMNGQRV